MFNTLIEHSSHQKSPKFRTNSDKTSGLPLLSRPGTGWQFDTAGPGVNLLKFFTGKAEFFLHTRHFPESAVASWRQSVPS